MVARCKIPAFAAVRRIGSEAGATTSWEAFINLSRTAVRLRGDSGDGCCNGSNSGWLRRDGGV
jgi:hypothetical protein